ncbi:hypothetical protein BBJ28_00001854 [Nothophytophthora sp. Chile5]|nr:hypothetical protein BBJ28_00001854 [Nothophytophthora sp. Chile5]
MLYPPAYQSDDPSGRYNKRQMLAPPQRYPPPYAGPGPLRIAAPMPRTPLSSPIATAASPSLPGLSSMLQQRRNPGGFTLSPCLPQDELMLSPHKAGLAPQEPATTSLLQATESTPSTTSSSSEDDPDVTRKRRQLLLNQGAGLAEKPPLASTTAGKPRAKSSRYLREMDRRVILSRIEQGEKQSALAKEYQVSRAAICNLNKHRDEVIARKDGNPLAKHPKKPRAKTLKAKASKAGWVAALALGSINTGLPTEKHGVHEIKSRAAALLLTTLRKRYTAMTAFRRASDRLMRLVMEEALAYVPVKTVEIFLSNQIKSDGVALEHPPCAISMEPAGCPMLDLFHLMEPDQPTGYVSFADVDEASNASRKRSVKDGREDLNDDDGNTKARDEIHVTLFDARLPGSLNYHNVFLVDHVVTSGELVCAAVRRLQEHGAVEAMISLVALLATAKAVEMIQTTFPAIKIVTAQVDNGGDERATRAAAADGEHDDLQPVQVHASTTDMILGRLEQVYQGDSVEVPY